MFKAVFLQKDDIHYQAKLTDIEESLLPKEEVTIQISHSSLNYKDALAITGKSPVVRRFPMIPGIDFAGRVIHSLTPHYQAGDFVLLNGWGVGEMHWGGLSQKACVPHQWLIPMPSHFTPQQTMAIGTAGYTAMLSVMALENHGITPKKHSVLVTGANGGVGSFSIALLSRLGYHVIASTGRMEEADYLTQVLGASEIIERKELTEPARALAKERWHAAIDSIGSHTLANVCAGTAYGGIVAACGLAQGSDFHSSVMPFILRGITLAGIDSVMRPYEDRVRAWERLSHLIDPALLKTISTEITLEETLVMSDRLIEGKVRGRLVVRIT